MRFPSSSTIVQKALDYQIEISQPKNVCCAEAFSIVLANKAIGRLLIDSRGKLDRLIGPCANRARSAELSHPFFFVAQTCTSLSPL